MALKFSSITQSVTVEAEPNQVFDAYVDSKKHAAITGSPAKMSSAVGGKFTAWDGYIHGRNLELEKGKRILQEWFTTEWPKDYPPSLLEITLMKTNGGTRLKMVHSRVPAEQRDDYAQGWRDYYWKPLKVYFKSKRRGEA